MRKLERRRVPIERDDRVQFGEPRRREVALRLEQLERRRQADVHALLLGLISLVAEFACLPGRIHPLQAGVDLPRRFANLLRHLQFEPAKSRHLLFALHLRLGEPASAALVPIG